MTALVGRPRSLPAIPRRHRPTHAALRMFEYDLLVFRRQAKSYLLSSLAQPFLYLISIGVGLGVYVNRAGVNALGGVSYLEFVAPALLATQAMMAGAFDSTHPIMSKFEWSKTYHAALNTPLGPLDLLIGELLWQSFRLLVMSVLFLVVMVAMGAVVSPLAILAVPVAILTGLAFAAPITAFTATQKRDTMFNALFRFGITPLFLFSGTFFPVERLPLIVQPLAWVTPLYHGVALARSLALGRPELVPSLLHVGVLLLFTGAGFAWGIRTYIRRLEV